MIVQLLLVAYLTNVWVAAASVVVMAAVSVPFALYLGRPQRQVAEVEVEPLG